MVVANKESSTRAFVLTLAITLGLLASSIDAHAARRNRVLTKAAPAFNQANYHTIEKVCDLYGLQVLAATGTRFSLAGQLGRIEGSPGSKLLRVNGTLVNLISPLVANRGQIHVSKADVAHVIDPLLRPRSVKSAKNVRTVVVDAGHGGHDSGARNKYGREKDFALDTARRLQKHLQSLGFKVAMTRSNDAFIPLPTRAAFASRHRDAIFVSIHYNKGRSGACGVETFALTPLGVSPLRSFRESSSPNPGNATDGANILLAAKIHRRVASSLQSVDRGVKFERFHVLRNNSVPAILVEGGFVSHPKEGRAIASARYRESLAKAIAEGIRDYNHTVSHVSPRRTVSNEKRRGLFSALFSRSMQREVN